MAELVERVDKDDHVLAVVERGEAIRHGWLHRVATSVCRDSDGRILVHRRPNDVSRFPGQYNWLIGGAVDVGET
jgi:isopentenyldiphosphate isomerase